MTINPHTYPNLGANPLDLVPTGLALQSSLILCAHLRCRRGMLRR